MELDKFIENIKEPEGRDYIAKLMCRHTRCIEYQKTLDAIRYLALPLLLILDDKIDEIDEQ
jgi:hypothetical protein